MTPVEAALAGWIVVAVVMVALWWVHVRTRDAGIVDVGWAYNLAILALMYAVLLDTGLGSRRWLVAALVALWSIRLGTYLLVDRVHGAEEDGRYRALRQRWGDRFETYMFPFFQAQAFLDVALSVAFLVVMLHPAPSLRILDAIGVAIVLMSILGESIADRQLARWRSEPSNRGRTCRRGLWKYSRHPNYFFECAHWLAYPVMAWGSPWWWASWTGVAVMYVFVRYITGIPPTEKQALRSRGDDYRRYQREVNALIPWFPRGETGAK